MTLIVDAKRIAARADWLGLDLVPPSPADRASLPEWARIVWVRRRRWYGLWDIRTKAPGAALPRGIGPRVKLRPTDVVADVGAFAGHFSVWCARKGVKRVTAYEPSLAAYRVLTYNATLSKSINTMNAAVVEDERATARIWIAGDGPGTSNSLVRQPRGSHYVDVPAISWASASAGATVLKIDVEGYEFELPILPVSPSVHTVLISFHLDAKDHRRPQAAAMRQALLDDGFRAAFDVDLSGESVFEHEGVYVR